MKIQAVTTAIVCLGQSFQFNQTMPKTFLARIHVTASTMLEHFHSFYPSAHNSTHELQNISPFFLILSGGDTKKNGVTEAEVMYRKITDIVREHQESPAPQFSLTPAVFNNSQSLFPVQVLLEEESRSTLENIYYSYALIQKYKIQRLYLVTNDFHLYRSLLLARVIWNQLRGEEGEGEGLEIIPIAAPTEDNTGFSTLHLPNYHHFSMIENKRKLEIVLRTLKRLPAVFLSRLSSLLLRRSERRNAEGILRSFYYRPWENRPADVNAWHIMEKLDLEKKAILSMQENFRKYPDLANITIPNYLVQKALDGLQEFNQTLIKQILYNRSDQKFLSVNDTHRSGSVSSTFYISPSSDAASSTVCKNSS